MRKIATMISCVLCVAMLTGQAALAEQVTLAELRAQTPETMTLTLPGEDGASVTVTISVIIPDAEGLHVQRVRPMLMDFTALSDKYTQVEVWATEPDRHHEYLCFERFAPKKKTKIFNDIQAGWNLYRDKQPDNNDMPWERPAEKLQEIIELCGWDADVRVVWQAATSQGYTARDKLGRSSRGEPYAIMTFNERYPVKGYEKGYYQLRMAQYLDGARIFGFDHGYFFPNDGEAEKYAPAGFDYYLGFTNYLHMNILSEDDFGIYMELLETERVFQSDVPLAPFDKIQESLEKYIAGGTLKTAYKIELGYAPMSELAYGETSLQKAGDVRTVLVPAWCVSGFDTKDDTYRAADEYTVPTEQEYWESGNRYYLWINAETGEILQYGQHAEAGV